MNEFVTKEDLRQFGLLLLDKIQAVFQDKNSAQKDSLEPGWLKSKAVRKLLDISAGSVQNLRTSQKVRFKKVLGSYYYNKEDLQKLFDDETKQKT
ncbi:helix-turn-helix domain-containing protein [Flavobacterium sp. LC2016-01]|uniref:helix-turn-helix domain-containing protein n=1 Tax=Flavobacterium sp. LC2016-01 TaxID=2675876 RepID=UPI0012BAC747|nr:helix-turn-helix domain-containing protein [Flavobacterium sp. LC2016-01]MTH15926.1 DNA-binding protein [Flavobacterium sp. LC2016-01]